MLGFFHSTDPKIALLIKKHKKTIQILNLLVTTNVKKICGNISNHLFLLCMAYIYDFHILFPTTVNIIRLFYLIFVYRFILLVSVFSLFIFLSVLFHRCRPNYRFGCVLAAFVCCHCHSHLRIISDPLGN